MLITQAKKKKVLVVDDDEIFLELIRDAFAEYFNIHLITHHIISRLDVIDGVVSM